MAHVCDKPELCVGTSDMMPANTEVQKICDDVKPQVEEKAKKKFNLFKAVSFISQTVVGTNYFIKVQVDENDFLHIRVFRSLLSDGYKISLHLIQTSKTSADPIDHFCFPPPPPPQISNY